MIFKAFKVYNEKTRLRRSGINGGMYVGLSTIQKSEDSTGYSGSFFIQPSSNMRS